MNEMILCLLVISLVMWIVVLFDLVLVVSSSILFSDFGSDLVRWWESLMIGCDSILLYR